MKQIGPGDLDDLSVGAVFLATGGGGDPYVAKLVAAKALEAHGPVGVVDPGELGDGARVVTVGGVGAPTVSLELLPSLDDAGKALAAFEDHVGARVDAVVSFEIGGGNSLIPIVAAAGRGIPVVDGDGMGRALPEAQMMTYPIYGVRPTPAIALDYAGNIVTFSTDSIFSYERQIRAIAMASGGMITACEHPMTGRQLKDSIVPNTLSFSIAIGRVLREHRGDAHSIFEPLKAAFAGSIYGELRHLHTGKVIDVQRSIVGGFDIGTATIESFERGRPSLTVDIKNEYLVARAGGDVVASVPDLITILDYETSTPINAERLRYGQRVTVYGIACPAHYRTDKALAVVAPRCFGFDFDYLPLEEIGAGRSPAPP